MQILVYGCIRGRRQENGKILRLYKSEGGQRHEGCHETCEVGGCHCPPFHQQLAGKLPQAIRWRR